MHTLGRPLRGMRYEVSANFENARFCVDVAWSFIRSSSSPSTGTSRTRRIAKSAYSVILAISAFYAQR
jgi:hypothetical protein